MDNNVQRVPFSKVRTAKSWLPLFKLLSCYYSIEEMRTINSEAETPNTIKKRIEDLKAQQKKDEVSG